MKCAYVFNFGQFLVMLCVFLSDDEPIFLVLFETTIKPVSKFWGLQNLSTFQIFLFFCEVTRISLAFAQNQALVLGCPGIRNSPAPDSCGTYLGSRCHVAWISFDYLESLLLPQLLRGENDSKQSDEIQASCDFKKNVNWLWGSITNHVNLTSSTPFAKSIESDHERVLMLSWLFMIAWVSQQTFHTTCR